MIDGSTRVFAILGDPVAHSLSPTMHNAAFKALGLAATYVPLRCAAQDVPQFMRVLAMAGGGGNVTVPHKEIAARSVDGPSARVRLLGACNTFWADDGAVCGDNTDVAGSDRCAQCPGPAGRPVADSRHGWRRAFGG